MNLTLRDACSPPNFSKKVLTKSKHKYPACESQQVTAACTVPGPRHTRVPLPAAHRHGAHPNQPPAHRHPERRPDPGTSRPAPLASPAPGQGRARKPPRGSSVPRRVSRHPGREPGRPSAPPRPPPEPSPQLSPAEGTPSGAAPYQKEVFAPLIGQPAPPGQSHGAGRLRGRTGGVRGRRAGDPSFSAGLSRSSPLPTPHPPPCLPAAGAFRFGPVAPGSNPPNSAAAPRSAAADGRCPFVCRRPPFVRGAARGASPGPAAELGMGAGAPLGSAGASPEGALGRQGLCRGTTWPAPRKPPP